MSSRALSCLRKCICGDYNKNIMRVIACDRIARVCWVFNEQILKKVWNASVKKGDNPSQLNETR